MKKQFLRLYHCTIWHRLIRWSNKLFKEVNILRKVIFLLPALHHSDWHALSLFISFYLRKSERPGVSGQKTAHSAWSPTVIGETMKSLSVALLFVLLASATAVPAPRFSFWHFFWRKKHETENKQCSLWCSSSLLASYHSHSCSKVFSSRLWVEQTNKTHETNKSTKQMKQPTFLKPFISFLV